MKNKTEKTLKKINELARSGQLALAIDTCNKALKKSPSNVDILLILSQLEYKKGNMDIAIEKLDKASTLKPRNSNIYALKGDIYIHNKKFSDAENAYRRALSNAPNKNLLKTRLAYALQEQKDKIDEAIELHESVCSEEPKNALAHYNLGTAFKRNNNFERAISAYEKAVELDPNNVELKESFSNILFETEHYQKAIAALEELLKLSPRNEIALYQLSYACKRLKLADKSLQAAERLVSITDHSTLSLRALSAAKIMQANYESALQDCEMGLQKNPKDRRLLSEKIIALSGTGDKNSAKNLFNINNLLMVIKIDPPSNFKNTNAFNKNIIEHINNHPTLSFAGISHSCSGGSTSNEIFVEPLGPIDYLLKEIHKAVENYIKKVKLVSPHPWVDQLPDLSKLNISGWATRLRNQGFQHGHIHDTGWISGVYYVNLPSKRDNQAGAIEFGRGPFFYPDVDQGEIRVIEPDEGTLVLFPSYFYHKTIPFESEQERVTIAFDYRTNDFS